MSAHLLTVKLPAGRHAQCLTCGEPFDTVTAYPELGTVLAWDCGHNVREQLELAEQ